MVDTKRFGLCALAGFCVLAIMKPEFRAYIPVGCAWLLFVGAFIGLTWLLAAIATKVAPPKYLDAALWIAAIVMVALLAWVACGHSPQNP